MYRLINSGAQEGVYNMAVDAAIFDYFRKGYVPPTIRVFWFKPPCVSIGRIQKPEPLSRLEYYLVRRPTGGRAVVHKDDLSYSIVCRVDDPVFGGDVLKTYMRSSLLFVDALKLIGIGAELVRTKSGDLRSPLCFQSISRFEVVSNGKKVMGNAQWRDDNSVLLQGSISVKADREILIEKYKSVLRDSEIDFIEGVLTDEEKSLAHTYIPRFRIERSLFD